MDFKIDTKTNHRLVTVFRTTLNDQLAEEISQMCADFTASPPGNIIFMFDKEAQMEVHFPEKLKALQDKVYAGNHSVVFTGMNDAVIQQCKKAVAEINVTPTLEEAIDMVSMEILERDLLQEDD